MLSLYIYMTCDNMNWHVVKIKKKGKQIAWKMLTNGLQFWRNVDSNLQPIKDVISTLVTSIILELTLIINEFYDSF